MKLGRSSCFLGTGCQLFVQMLLDVSCSDSGSGLLDLLLPCDAFHVRLCVTVALLRPFAGSSQPEARKRERERDSEQIPDHCFGPAERKIEDGCFEAGDVAAHAADSESYPGTGGVFLSRALVTDVTDSWSGMSLGHKSHCLKFRVW